LERALSLNYFSNAFYIGKGDRLLAKGFWVGLGDRVRNLLEFSGDFFLDFLS